MKRLVVIALVFCSCSVAPSWQQRKLVSVFHLIETAKYADARELVEEMINHKESSQWARTWYARGLLCQSAYRDGVAKSDKSLTELYPDQLFVAWESFERALALDRGGRIERQLPARYIYLANEFQKSGAGFYEAKKYHEALRAYEQAFRITLSPVMTVRIDTGLVFNTGLAAYQAHEWDKAIRYLGRLHDQRHSTNVSHLLHIAYLSAGDTISAARVLEQGIERYSNNENMVLLLADLLYTQGKSSDAANVLDKAIKRDTASATLWYTKGVVLQKTGAFNEAINAYKIAHDLDQKNPEVCLNLATCFYNIGVETEEIGRLLSSINGVEQKRQEAAEAFSAASFWLNKAYSLRPGSVETLVRMDELSKRLQVPSKAGSSGVPGP